MYSALRITYSGVFYSNVGVGSGESRIRNGISCDIVSLGNASGGNCITSFGADQMLYLAVLEGGRGHGPPRLLDPSIGVGI